MPLSVCPASEVNASIEKTWSLLYEPAKYGTWADANVMSVSPVGFAQAGQIINLTSKSLGVKWHVSLHVISVDVINHRIIFETHLPFKLILKNNISCIENDEKACLVRYA
jgi:hypothetical protein